LTESKKAFVDLGWKGTREGSYGLGTEYAGLWERECGVGSHELLGVVGDDVGNGDGEELRLLVKILD
jgi:hypothetical protein